MTGGAGHSRQTGNSKPNHHRDRASRRSGSRDVVDTLSQPAKQNENASRPAFTLPSAILMTLSLDLTQNQTKYQQGHDSVEDTAFSRIGQAEADWYPLRSAPWADARLPALSHGTPTRVTTTAAAADDDDNDDSTASMSASVGSVSPPSHSYYPLAVSFNEEVSETEARWMIMDKEETIGASETYSHAFQDWGDNERSVVSTEINWTKEDCYSQHCRRPLDEEGSEFAGSPYYQYVCQTPYPASISDADIWNLDSSGDLGAGNKDDEEWDFVERFL